MRTRSFPGHPQRTCLLAPDTSTSMWQPAPGGVLAPQHGDTYCIGSFAAVNEDVIRSTADKLIELGLRDAGYVYLNIDGKTWQCYPATPQLHDKVIHSSNPSSIEPTNRVNLASLSISPRTLRYATPRRLLAPTAAQRVRRASSGHLQVPFRHGKAGRGPTQQRWEVPCHCLELKQHSRDNSNSNKLSHSAASAAALKHHSHAAVLQEAAGPTEQAL